MGFINAPYGVAGQGCFQGVTRNGGRIIDNFVADGTGRSVDDMCYKDPSGYSLFQRDINDGQGHILREKMDSYGRHIKQVLNQNENVYLNGQVGNSGCYNGTEQPIVNLDGTPAYPQNYDNENYNSGYDNDYGDDYGDDSYDQANIDRNKGEFYPGSGGSSSGFPPSSNNDGLRSIVKLIGLLSRLLGDGNRHHKRHDHEHYDNKFNDRKRFDSRHYANNDEPHIRIKRTRITTTG